jgi:hypothetical protein
VRELLDKPLASGRVILGRFAASAVLAAAMVGLVTLLPQRAGKHPKLA